MRIEGTESLEGTPEEIFERLLDPVVLCRCIPGCERMEETSRSTYESTVRVGIGSIKGTFRTTVKVADVVRPERYRLSIRSRSSLGHAEGTADIVLAACDAAGAGMTVLRYAGEARVSGTIAAVGQRLLGVAAKKLTAAFFERLKAEIAQASLDD